MEPRTRLHSRLTHKYLAKAVGAGSDQRTSLPYRTINYFSKYPKCGATTFSQIAVSGSLKNGIASVMLLNVIRLNVILKMLL